jgi:hypothetical protein
VARRFSALDVLAKSLPIWAWNIGKFTALYVILQLPIVAYLILAALLGSEDMDLHLVVVGFGACVFAFIAPLVVVHGVLDEIRGVRASFRDCLRVCLSRFFPALGAGLLVGFLALASTIPTIIIGVALFQGRLPWLPRLFALFPAVLVASVCFVAIPVAASEGAGVAASLRRSARLTRGSRRSIAVLVVLVVALWAAPAMAETEHWSLFLVQAVLGGFGAVVTSVSYNDLRAAMRVDALERVFA